MKLKPKPNRYEITYSIKKSPDQWAFFHVEEDQVISTIAMIQTQKEWQLEAVALINSSIKNRYDLPVE